MTESRSLALAWKLKRLAISGFLLVHISATLIWVMPTSPLRTQFFDAARMYILPLGFWQYWGMFAPDPVRDPFTLEADIVDSRGIRANFAFERTGDDSVPRAMPRFRHPKFAANLLMPENGSMRVLAAKHVLRKLALPSEAYPLSVSLIYQVRPTPPPGGPPLDPMTPKQAQVLTELKFASISEVSP